MLKDSFFLFWKYYINKYSFLFLFAIDHKHFLLYEQILQEKKVLWLISSSTNSEDILKIYTILQYFTLYYKICVGKVTFCFETWFLNEFREVTAQFFYMSNILEFKINRNKKWSYMYSIVLRNKNVGLLYSLLSGLSKNLIFLSSQKMSIVCQNPY